MDHEALVRELEALLRETYSLWEEGWVNFNWRGYTYDHVQRVRGLALRLCRDEDGDNRVVDLAALLHDITKAYDGDYALDAEGKRAVDAHGYWMNATRRPAGRNVVTDLYDRLVPAQGSALASTLHNITGAEVARHLLRARGVEEGLVEAVARTIADHLRPPADAPLESRCLYDADTIDANIGLPAFVRNIHIHLHYRDVRKRPDELPTDRMLAEDPLEYLGPYIAERLPAWSDGKRNDFIPKLTTAAARVVAEERLARLEGVWAQLRRELDDFAPCAQRGCLAVVLHVMRHRDGDPSIAAETAYLANGWLATVQPTPEARDLVAHLVRESEGHE